MNKWIKKGLAVTMTSIMVTGLVACSGESGKGSNNSSSETSDSSGKVLGDVTAETDISGATIEIAYNKADTAEDFFALVGSWADANGVTIQETSYGEEHEAQMKTRMGSGDLPDIWMTHGWSINRYGEYLMDLSDQPWVVDIDPGLKDVITTDDGELYILPITQSIASVTYNADVLEEAEVDPSEIRTWDDFSEALAAIKDKTDASPLAISLDETGFDSYTLELILPSLYTNADCADNKADKFLDGTFDFAKDAEEVWTMLSDWYNAGYYNEDLVSCKRDDLCQMLATGEAAFTFYAAMNPSILAYNPDANIGILPVPASSDSAASYFGVGEGNYGCFGVCKDTEYPEACKELLKYLAQSEVAEQVCEWDGGIPGLISYEMPEDAESAVTATAYKNAQEMFDGDLIYDNVFDREYLPSGMWSNMGDAGKELFTDGDPEGHTAAAAKILQDSYDELIKGN